MSERHDPCADPLTPELRAKVERAFSSIGTPKVEGPLTALERAALSGRPSQDLGLAIRYGVSTYRVRDARYRARAKTQRGGQ